MQSVESLLLKIAQGHASKPKHLYHFTSIVNIPSIRQHGLLSQRRIMELGLSDVNYASDETSRQSDRSKGLDGHVHLCFFAKHRMEYVAKEKGRVAACEFLRVSPQVLRLPGVQLGTGATNSDEVEIGDVTAMLPKLDWEVIYNYTDWNDPAVNQRLQAAQMYEILVPEAIASEYLLLP